MTITQGDLKVYRHRVMYAVDEGMHAKQSLQEGFTEEGRAKLDPKDGWLPKWAERSFEAAVRHARWAAHWGNLVLEMEEEFNGTE